ncbi:hypothetical protein HMPREF9624_01381 [Oribacterium asaccharolyticum ACB7]|uniref:Hydrogenase maturation GTPase HydF n=1 Tax=Oribacterium asaccharolyticum ACB7 TaxID=796944 RepID=G9WX07_9FIRM|nr:GTP-binding protein [Oribacterium asaccharolyticum]EHL09340.1 hypothetical protein HMPREF9624_01381 [Oribacterium asaccharolyticum ACB7]
MSLQDTPQSERIHIGFFGRRNAGKSSLINAIAGQPVSLVSETPGTTTDPVRKAMEILPLGPVLLIDTPGIDDEGSLGEMRVARSKEVIRETDIALLVLSAKVFLEENASFLQRGLDSGKPPVFRLLKALKREQFLLPERERALLADFREEDIPVMLIFSQVDRLSEAEREALQIVIKILREEKTKYGILEVRSSSGLSLEGIEEIKSALGVFLPKQKERRLFSGLVEAGDYIVLVSPIDESAPKGRLILPQQMAIRDLLDYHAIPLVAQPEELKTIMESLKGKVKLVVTDSQAFKEVECILEKAVPLTSFSILMARYKGFLSYALEGCAVLDSLEEGDKIYIAEGCTHHRQCGDIGTVKLPKMLEKYSGKKLDFVFTEGKGFLSEEKQKELKLMIHCGACMLSEREVQSRYRDFLDKGIPICNYGLAMAKMNGILDRAVAML